MKNCSKILGLKSGTNQSVTKPCIQNLERLERNEIRMQSDVMRAMTRQVYQLRGSIDKVTRALIPLKFSNVEYVGVKGTQN